MGVGLWKQNRVSRIRSSDQRKKREKRLPLVIGNRPETTASQSSKVRSHAVARRSRPTSALLHFCPSAGVDLDSQISGSDGPSHTSFKAQ